MKVTAFQPYLTVFLCVCTERRNHFTPAPKQMMESENRGCKKAGPVSCIGNRPGIFLILQASGSAALWV